MQLSGSEPWEVNEHVQRPILKCMKVRAEESAQSLFGTTTAARSCCSTRSCSGTYGGTGQTLDWGVAAEIARWTPTVLAGGLTPENVGDAVRTVHPWAVDVSSGVETDGVKDATRSAPSSCRQGADTPAADWSAHDHRSSSPTSAAASARTAASTSPRR